MFYQKLRILLAGILLSTAYAEKVPQYRLDFENLPQEERDQFYEYLMEAKRLFSQQRIFEAIDVVENAEKLISEFPALMSIKGACYVEFRDFDKAEDIFKRSLEISPNNHGIFFNIGEINFVQGKWEECKKYFKLVMQTLETVPTDPTFLLAELKTYIADKKLGNNAACSTIEDKYNFTFDSPIYYYINAVKEFEADNNSEAQLWLLRARRVYTGGGQLDAWHDCLVESGYIKSFYGGGERDELDVQLNSGGAPSAPGLDLSPIPE